MPRHAVARVRTKDHRPLSLSRSGGLWNTPVLPSAPGDDGQEPLGRGAERPQGAAQVPPGAVSVDSGTPAGLLGSGKKKLCGFA